MTVPHPENVLLPLDRPGNLRHVAQVARSGDGTAPSPGRGLPVLRLLSAGNTPRDHVLAVGRNTVGRLPDNDVVVASPYVSRRHCAILVLPDGTCILLDLGSTGGVYVGGERIKYPLRLRDGDEIRVGGRRLVLLASENGTANSEPAD